MMKMEVYYFHTRFRGLLNVFLSSFMLRKLSKLVFGCGHVAQTTFFCLVDFDARM